MSGGEQMEGIFDAEAHERAERAPRERTNGKRSRAADDTRHMERQDMDFYAPPNQLEVPQAEGFVYRWVAEYVNGAQTPRNVQMRIREGYQRVRIDELPEDFIVDEDIKGDGVARTGGLILMRMPKPRHDARSEYYRKRSSERLHAVNEIQGIAGRNAVEEDRGTGALTGAAAQRFMAT
jgi:hypothetical protein